ncbi:MAG: phage tail tape measure protein [Bosea sp.]|nr:phage tail tape measure protein [Bosea sp. (in: a-proteobacteria)]
MLAMVSRNFDRLNRAANHLNAVANNPRAQQQIQQSISRTTALTAGMGAAAMRAAGPLAGMFTLYGAGAQLASANRAFARNERAMTRIGVTADASMAAQQASWQQLQQLAQETAQPVEKVRDGLDSLVASGRSLPEAMAFLPAVARTAQASGSEVADIAKTADSVGESFKLVGADMQAAFDIMAAGGKAGKFELKDMARYLPSLGPAASAIGFSGKKGLSDLVAMLQIMRKGSGTAEEAVGSMNNILNKMESDETAKKFKKLGVDSEAAFKKARAEGRNLVEVFEELVNTALKGDRSRIGELIQDQEFRRGAQALMMFKGEWQDLSRTMQATSTGTVANDLARVLGDKQATFDRFTNSASRLADILGKRVAPAFQSMATAAASAMDAAAEALKPGETDQERLERIGNRPKTRAEQAIENARRAQERQKKLDDPASEYYGMRDGGFAGSGARTQSAREALLRAKKSRTPLEQIELDRIEHGGFREQASKTTAKKLDDPKWHVETRVSSHMNALAQHRAARRAAGETQEIDDYRERQRRRAEFLRQEREQNAADNTNPARSGDVYRDVDVLRRDKLRIQADDERASSDNLVTDHGQASRDMMAGVMNLAQLVRGAKMTEQGEANVFGLGGDAAQQAARSTIEMAVREIAANQAQASGQPVDESKIAATVAKLTSLAERIGEAVPPPGSGPRGRVDGLAQSAEEALKGTQLTAEVKPGQITAQANVDVTSQVSVKVEPTPDFWAKVDAKIEAKTPKSMAGVSLPGKEGGGAPSSAARRF